MNNKKGLGRGLGSLLAVFDEETEVEEVNPQLERKISGEVVAVKTVATNNVNELDIEKIRPNPNQPRKNFDESALKELSDSIKMHGIIQPIVVNKDDEGFLIIAGERRWRAAKMAGLKTVPAIIKSYTEKQIKEIAIIENLQREDLNPIEAARAIKQLMEEYNFTQEVVADRIGKSRPSVANSLRLLSLTPEVIKLIEDDRLSAGHARCLVVLSDAMTQYKFANAACDNKMSVRDLEKQLKNYLNPKTTKPKEKQEHSIELKDLINEMQRTFATKVSVIGNDSKGRIYIDYYSRDDLDRIVEILELVKKQKLTLQDLNNYNKHFKS